MKGKLTARRHVEVQVRAVASEKRVGADVEVRDGVVGTRVGLGSWDGGGEGGEAEKDDGDHSRDFPVEIDDTWIREGEGR